MDKGPSACDARPSKAPSNDDGVDCSATATQSQTTCVLALDPGLTGATAFQSPVHNWLTVDDMPVAAVAKRVAGGGRPTVTIPCHTEGETRPRASLAVAAWLRKEIPARDYLMGELLSTTSRWLLYGETGVGKTLFAMDLGAAVASGQPLLGWTGGRKARVMYLDGELPEETFKERMELIAKRYGPDIALYGYNRDDLGDAAMPPLNTQAGRKWLWKEIGAVEPNVIIFDAIMSLVSGPMDKEESWAPVKELARQITKRRIAQIWLHHTGHNTSQGYGTKTREWEMDTVLSLTWQDKAAETVRLEFTKTRLRRPETRDQFEPRVIRYEDGTWVSKPEPPRARGKAADEKGAVRRAIVSAYQDLAGSQPARDCDGLPVGKVKVDDIRDRVKSGGLLDLDEKGNVSASGRTIFRREKIALIENRLFAEQDGYFWRVNRS